MKPSTLQILLTNAFKNNLKILIKGAPGLGKSEIVEQSARDAGAELIIMHPAVSDPTDFKGLPAIKDELAQFLPYTELRKLQEATKKTICFIDDIGQAPGAVQAALMQLIQARQINGVKISDHVTFCGATNDASHMAGVSSILEPVKSRWDTIVELTADLTDWKAWALRNDIPAELIAFISLKPDLLSKFAPSRDLTNSPSPRTAASVAKWVKAGIINNNELAYEVISGAAGEAFAAEFLAFIKVFHLIPSINEIALSPTTARLPDDPATKFAVTAMLTFHSSSSNIGAFLIYLSRLGSEWQTKTIREAIIKNPDIAETSAFIDWASENNQFIS